MKRHPARPILVGPAAHQRAVAAVQERFNAIPVGTPVRLAKRTSNLFRPRRKLGTGLAVDGLDSVISINTESRTADVQGMCSYERLVATTLARGLMPSVVPQLKTITLGGAVTGLGVESTSYRNGLPHESVVEIDVLTGTGQIVTASAQEHSELFSAFPNSYGSLGYALRLRIELEPVSAFVALHHVRFAALDDLTDAVGEIVNTGTWRGERVDFLDGVMFAPDESYLCLGAWSERAQASDYTGQQIFFRSIRERERDALSVHDYLWRWDTDWFWCSGALGLHNPIIRRLWPRRARRSDVYHRIVAFENRHGIAASLDRRRGKPPRERVVQDFELPLERTAEFLHWFADRVAMTPVWLCPLRTKRAWPLYPLQPRRTYVNVGFWGTVPIAAGTRDGDVNRDLEDALAGYGGHKSLYSDVYYARDSFDAMYGGPTLQTVRERYDPQQRLIGMYEKVVSSR